MDARLQGAFKTIEVLEPTEAEGLQVFGLRRNSEGNLTYTTLDVAPETGALEITEVSEGASVPTLMVENKGDARFLLISGEQLIGAKQNRVLNISIMVGARSRIQVPVSCVEAGCWAYRTRAFSSSRSSSHSFLRKIMAGDVPESYRTRGRPASKQNRVWGEVDRKLCRMTSRSPSAELEQVYNDYQDRLNAVRDKVSVPEDCCGVAFAFGGRVAGVDLFDKPVTLQKLLPKLVRAYAIDAMEEAEAGPRLDRDSVMVWLCSAAESETYPFDSPGLGIDLRIEGKNLVGASLVVDDVSAHIELFPDNDEERIARGSSSARKSRILS